MAPPVLHRVINQTTRPSPTQVSSLTICPAILHQYTRHRVAFCDYPAVLPSSDPSACVRGTYVTGLTASNQKRLDVFEGNQYERIKVKVKLVEREGEVVECETYAWVAGEEELEGGEWDFEVFTREKMGRWVGDEEYEEVDEAVEREKHDPTGGRRMNDRITEGLEGEQKGLKDEVLESAV